MVSESTLEIIMHAGNSKSLSMEAIELARQGEINDADYKIGNAQEELVIAYKVNSKLLQKNKKVNELNPNILFVHAQDHLHDAQTQLEMAKEIICLYEQIQEIKNYLGLENFKRRQYMRVLLVCGQGMSTSLLVQSMYMFADEGDYIESTSFEELVGVIGEYDVILVSPQIRFRMPVIERMTTPRTQVIGLIDMKAYGKLDGESIYAQAKKLFNKINN